MGRNPLEAALFGLGLAALVNSCVETTPKSPPNPSATPANPPIVEIQPTPAATPPPPFLRTKGIIMFPTPEVHEISQELKSLYNYLLYPTFAAIEEKSFKDYMDSRGYQFFVTENRFPETGIVLDPDGVLTKKLPTEAAETLIEENTLRQAEKIPLRFMVVVRKKGEKEESHWIARFAKVKIGNNPPVEIWAFNEIDDHIIAAKNKK